MSLSEEFKKREAAKSEAMKDRRRHPIIDGDLLLDPDTSDVFILWPGHGPAIGALYEPDDELPFDALCPLDRNWESGYEMRPCASGSVVTLGGADVTELQYAGHAINQRPPEEVRERLVWFGNLFGWSE